jgi:hypothetical protein
MAHQNYLRWKICIELILQAKELEQFKKMFDIITVKPVESSVPWKEEIGSM